MKKISSTRLTSALAVGAFGILAACSPKTEQTADTLTTTPPAPAVTPVPAEAAWTDANVVDVLTVANQGEVDYSQIGAEKATRADVKKYAKLMVKEHGAMLEAVKSLATKLNVTPATNEKARLPSSFPWRSEAKICCSSTMRKNALKPASSREAGHWS